MFTHALKKIKNIMQGPPQAKAQVVYAGLDREGNGSFPGIASRKIIETPSDEIEKYNHGNIPELSLEIIIPKYDLSVRLKNVLKNDDFPFSSIETYLVCPDPCKELKGKVRSCGQKTAVEFEKYIGLTCKVLSFFSGKKLDGFEAEEILSNSEFLSFNNYGFNTGEAQQFSKLISEAVAKYGKEHVDEVLSCSLNLLQYKHSLENLSAARCSINDSSIKNLLSHYTVPECFQTIPTSVRLENILNNFKNESATEKYKNLCDCAYDYHKLKQNLARIKNYGRKSSDEFDAVFRTILVSLFKDKGVPQNETNRLVDCYQHSIIQSNKYVEIVSKINDHIGDQHEPGGNFDLSQISLFTHDLSEEDCRNESILSDKIFTELSQKDLEILSRRYGLFGNKKETLEEVAKDWNVTRERIRQLQSKIINKKLGTYKSAFQIFVDAKYEEITSFAFDQRKFVMHEALKSNIGKLDSFLTFALCVCYGKEINFFKKKHKKISNCWLRGDLDQDDINRLTAEIKTYGDPNKKLNLVIKKILTTRAWPLEINHLHSELKEFDPTRINDELCNNFEAEIDQGKIISVRKNIDTNDKILIVFRAAKKAMSPEDTTKIYNRFFDENISSGTISNYLGSHPDALIVARGLYDIYENINLSESDLLKIRNECYKFLNERDIYISAGVLYQKIYMSKHSYGAAFNRYMLYGILQDDNRFKYRRGLMVGLQHFSEESFVGLTETLCDAVKEHGPITIKELQALLSNQRAVLDVTIGITLDTNEECIKVGPSQYDYIKRVFPLHLSLTDLTDAIFLALIDGPKTITYIKHTLENVGIEIKTYPLISWIDKKDELNRNRKLVSLSEIPKHIQTYINEYDKVILYTSDTNEIIEKLASSDHTENLQLYKLDARLKKAPSKSENEEDDELDKILGDFGF